MLAVSQTVSRSDEFGRVIELLQVAKREPASLGNAIRALQDMVWNSQDWASGVAEDVAEQLRDLAYDLDYFEPDADARAEDPAYFAEDRAMKEIADALARIGRG